MAQHLEALFGPESPPCPVGSSLTHQPGSSISGRLTNPTKSTCRISLTPFWPSELKNPPLSCEDKVRSGALSASHHEPPPGVKPSALSPYMRSLIRTSCRTLFLKPVPIY